MQRLPIGLQCASALVSGAGIYLLPDTPRWYFARGRNEEGLQVLSRLYDRPVEDEDVQEMMGSILISIKLEETDEHKFNWMHLFWDRSDLAVGRRVRISFLLLSVQQMMGEHPLPMMFLGSNLSRDQLVSLLQHGDLLTSWLVAFPVSIVGRGDEYAVGRWHVVPSVHE